MDEIIYGELASVANHQISLDLGLALRHVYPAVKFSGCHADYASALFTKEEQQSEFLYRNQLHARVSSDFLLSVATASKTYQEFYQYLLETSKKLSD
jgi:transcription termination factor Rho